LPPPSNTGTPSPPHLKPYSPVQCLLFGTPFAAPPSRSFGQLFPMLLFLFVLFPFPWFREDLSLTFSELTALPSETRAPVKGVFLSSFLCYSFSPFLFLSWSGTQWPSFWGDIFFHQPIILSEKISGPMRSPRDSCHFGFLFFSVSSRKEPGTPQAIAGSLRLWVSIHQKPLLTPRQIFGSLLNLVMTVLFISLLALSFKNHSPLFRQAPSPHPLCFPLKPVGVFRPFPPNEACPALTNHSRFLTLVSLPPSYGTLPAPYTFGTGVVLNRWRAPPAQPDGSFIFCLEVPFQAGRSVMSSIFQVQIFGNLPSQVPVFCVAFLVLPSSGCTQQGQGPLAAVRLLYSSLWLSIRSPDTQSPPHVTLFFRFSARLYFILHQLAPGYTLFARLTKFCFSLSFLFGCGLPPTVLNSFLL